MDSDDSVQFSLLSMDLTSVGVLFLIDIADVNHHDIVDTVAIN